MAETWHQAPASLNLGENEVHIWQVELGQPLAIINELRQHLTADELARAKRFHFEKDRKHFIVGRGVLRQILSRYLQVNPSSIRFSYKSHGKPFIEFPHEATTLNFNLSHSGNVALYAFSQQRELGIDVEKLRPMPDGAQIAKRFFSAPEYEVFLSVPEAKRDEAFFNCWTRKEAYIKAIGDGLSYPLDAFQVSLKPGDNAALLHVRDAPQEVARWALHHLDPRVDYIGAIIVEGQDLSFSQWLWSQ